MEVTTVKIQGTGYLINNTLVVPNIEGNRHYKMIQEYIAEGGTVDPEFTQEELDAKGVQETNDVIYQELNALDLASIRDIREYIAAQVDAPPGLIDRELIAISKRAEIK